jgi:hydrogenase expression/formation protein HypC
MRISEITPERNAVPELDGVSRRISVRLLDDVQTGDFVLVHAGYAIEKLDPVKAREQLQIMEELKKGLLSE